MKSNILYRYYFISLVLVIFCNGCTANQKNIYGISGNHDITLIEDTVSLLRNPCMGWGLYDDASDEVQNADEYWKIQDKAANNFASFFYVRWRWSDMEPKEGKYAWVYNENYKKLIQGAKDRGLKLAFRVYDNSKDNLRQSTPDYVRKAGAEGYIIDNKWTPYPDDPIFQEKLKKFVETFALEYDNPEIVDFVDGYNVGWWGEGHGVKLKDKNKSKDLFEWYTDLYSKNFTKVIPITTFAGRTNFQNTREKAVRTKGYGLRRDGLGSMYFSQEQQDIASEMYGKSLLIGESCWWQASTDDIRPFEVDEMYNLKTWRDVYELTYKQAIEFHFNTLDLREIIKTKGWTERAEDLVQNFIVNGGYRFYPPHLSVPDKIENGKSFKLGHVWTNRATGYLPNNNPKWDYKYKPVFALLDQNNTVIKIWTDEAADPSTWLKGRVYAYILDAKVDNIPPGKYTWALAIIDKSLDNKPGIEIAVEKQNKRNEWVILREVNVL